MNCPDCDNMLYQGMCSCGYKVPPISTIEIKRIDTRETNFPLPVNEQLKNVPLKGKEYARYCIDYAKKILRGEEC